tara:strand:- start:250 stop:795 length:546 start_codon:yes stop_codon:yes gene_type:complete
MSNENNENENNKSNIKKQENENDDNKYLDDEDIELYNGDKVKKSILGIVFHPVIEKYIKFNIGSYYTYLHLGIIILGAYVICFVNDLQYLTIFMIILSCNAFTNIILHDCPLSMLEQKYLDTSIVQTRIKSLKAMNINYECDRYGQFESQLEFIINTASLCIFKIFFIIFYKHCFLNTLII